MHVKMVTVTCMLAASLPTSAAVSCPRIATGPTPGCVDGSGFHAPPADPVRPLGGPYGCTVGGLVGGMVDAPTDEPPGGPPNGIVGGPTVEPPNDLANGIVGGPVGRPLGGPGELKP